VGGPAVGCVPASSQASLPGSSWSGGADWGVKDPRETTTQRVGPDWRMSELCGDRIDDGGRQVRCQLRERATHAAVCEDAFAEAVKLAGGDRVAPSRRSMFAFSAVVSDSSVRSTWKRSFRFMTAVSLVL